MGQDQTFGCSTTVAMTMVQTEVLGSNSEILGLECVSIRLESEAPGWQHTQNRLSSHGTGDVHDFSGPSQNQPGCEK